jgi:putative mRNA 3-end processing factor
MKHPACVAAAGSLGLDADGEGGIVVRGLGLWLDPPGARPAAFVSHAHALQALGAGRVLASPETLVIARALGLAPGEARAIGWGEAVELPVAREYGGGTARLSIAHAGHMLGAAQLIVDHPRGRLVYAGDWSSQSEGTHPPGALIACDELAVTTGFALPIFQFEPLAAPLGALVDWCGQQLGERITPVVLAQSPGLAQTILLALRDRGLPAAVHDDVASACRAYESAGVRLGEVRPYAPGVAGPVVVASTRTKRSGLRLKGRSLVAYASGWALLDAMVEQQRADAAFVTADHADSDSLVSLVKGTGARLIHATYGDARAFAELLHERGAEAVSAHEAGSIDERRHDPAEAAS